MRRRPPNGGAEPGAGGVPESAPGLVSHHDVLPGPRSLALEASMSVPLQPLGWLQFFTKVDMLLLHHTADMYIRHGGGVKDRGREAGLAPRVGGLLWVATLRSKGPSGNCFPAMRREQRWSWEPWEGEASGEAGKACPRNPPCALHGGAASDLSKWEEADVSATLFTPQGHLLKCHILYQAFPGLGQAGKVPPCLQKPRALYGASLVAFPNFCFS